MYNYKFLTVLLLVSFVNAQTITSNKEHYIWFDQNLGLEHTGLANGTNYEKLIKTKKGHHVFLDTPDFTKGFLIYDEQPYFDISIKYNIFNDEVMIRLQNVFQLIKEKIEHFIINGRKFTLIKAEITESKKASGFHEILMEKPLFLLLKKHIKKQKKVDLVNRYHFEFIYKTRHGILYNDTYYSLKTEKDLIKLFPALKKDIKSYAASFKSIQKKNTGNYFKKILEQLHPKIAKQANMQ